MDRTADDPATLSVTGVLREMAAGRLTAEKLVVACLARIRARERTVRAWQYIDDEGALAAAMLCDERPPAGSLPGIPVGLKDIIETADMPTTYGSSIYEGYRPDRDAVCVRRLKGAGAIVLGKTVTTTFAHRNPGKTRNPHNPKHTPGGSSSGSAAAVADRMVPLALGTQTGGSVIRPAAYCGVIGYKPAFGVFDFTGIKHLSRTLDTLGFYVRSLDDVPLVAGVLAGGEGPIASGEEHHSAPRIALVRTPPWPSAEAAARALVEEVAARLAGAGAALREVELPPPFPDLYDVHMLIQATGAVEALAFEREHHWDEIPAPTQELIEEGRRKSETEIAAAEALAAECRETVARLFAEDEIILTLSAPGEAPAGLRSTGDAVFNRLWTLLHLPCLHLPVGRGPRGLPLGIQLIAPQRNETALLAGARWAARRLDLDVFD